MVTITRNLARQFRMFARKLGIASGRLSPAVSLSGTDGLIVRAQGIHAAIEYCFSGEFAQETLTVPFDLLVDCEGRQEEQVTIERGKGDEIIARWSDGGVPQLKRYKAQEESREFPDVPDKMLENSSIMLNGLSDAMEAADQEATRFALQCIQLRGKTGQLVATDGRQILVQGGYKFPWKEDLLIPGTKVFGSKDLQGLGPVHVGRTQDWVAIRISFWTFYLAIEKEGRFPEIQDFLKNPDDAPARITFSDADARFFAKVVKKLPSYDEVNRPLTVDLNGQVVIRAKSEDQPRITEVVLSGSSSSGEKVRFNTNRKFLAQALKLGFRKACVFGTEAPVLCHDDTRQYVWAVLDGDNALKPGKDVIRIESPAPDADHQPPPQPQRSQSMPRKKATDNGHPESNGAPTTEQLGTDHLIEQAEGLKASLKESVSRTTELISALKKQRKQNRVVQSTLASLKQIQAMDA